MNFENQLNVLTENNFVGVKNGDCADVGISQNATFEFTVTADQCFTEEKEVVRSLFHFLFFSIIPTAEV